MSFTINTLQSALASVERVFDILDEDEVEPDPEPAAAAHVDQPTQGHIAFEHVRFGYSPDKPLMRDVSFEARPGQKIAIVGATGAGKTTLINLLMRFYEIDGGRITLDGVDTRAMDRGELRQNFGMVLQDAWLFDGTIADNIAYGCPGATREQIIEAARMAHVDFFVRTMPQGYDTHVANDAENISQGQRQLLTIARVILCDPRILILDEATSSVDTRTEQAIVHAMETLMQGRTSFVIAHRLSTIVDADLILVMQAGTIIEQGTHQELLEAGGSPRREPIGRSSCSKVGRREFMPRCVRRVAPLGTPLPRRRNSFQTAGPRSAKIDLQWQSALCQNRPSVAAKSHFRPSMSRSAAYQKNDQAFYLGLAKIGLRWR